MEASFTHDCVNTCDGAVMVLSAYTHACLAIAVDVDDLPCFIALYKFVVIVIP